MGWIINHGKKPGDQLDIDSNNKKITPRSATLGNIKETKEIVDHAYTEEEIKNYRLDEAINEHPLAHRPTNIRSKLAYKEIISNLKPTKKYLLPGQVVCFYYQDPKYKEELEYYDKTPCTVFCGITRTKDDVIREIGINLHYFPPHTRARVMIAIYEAFKPYWAKNFNEVQHKPNTFISYETLQHICKRNSKIAFAVKMYIPVLRGLSYVLPGKYLSTAMYTEGHFSKATLAQIQRFWRQFK